MALEHKMIEPFVDTQVREGVVSYGLSSYGYDIRVADEFKVFTNINNTLIDPKNFDPLSFVDDLPGFSDDEIRLVMRENGLELSVPRGA